MALSAFISGWQHCRPVNSIDGTSLKNKYRGTLLSASTPDANDQIFPLAFCVVILRMIPHGFGFATN
ncbi:protein FAR1-RELATED SEQUENCE 3-like [Cucumis melo var. makuwa]|uniref:Protein FAR1-RELATED SEQUENCE 3-like n=2 Tax=Cucumis melo TaxID=3656 RepID=A0A5A7UFF0_CUCMM|nr:protein FAR1-RELATED SEQUENCE 3-like [Cucumis melo var. makuwa]TYK01804.1 protein FAR1-RELATED SEQUENCE 3-like [Cucumis melo var. makuwa]